MKHFKEFFISKLPAILLISIIFFTVPFGTKVHALEEYRKEGVGDIIGTSDSRMAITVVDNEDHVELQVSGIGEVRAANFTFCLVFNSDLLSWTDENLTRDIPFGSAFSDYEGPGDTPVLTISSSFLDKYPVGFEHSALTHQPLTEDATGMNSLYTVVGSNSASINMHFEPGEMVHIYSIFFKKKTQNPITSSDFGFYVNPVIMPPARESMWVYEVYAIANGTVPGIGHIVVPELFIYRSPSSVETKETSEISTTSAVLNGAFTRGDLSPSDEIMVTNKKTPTYTGLLNWDNIEQYGFIYSDEDADIVVNGISKKLNIDGTDYDFPDATELAAGEFERNSKTFYVTIATNASSDQSVSFDEEVTGLSENTDYYVWSYIHYTFETSDAYLQVGDKVTFKTENCGSISAPVASASQTFCGAATVANLVATVESGKDLEWYDASDVLLASDELLVDGETYYAKAAVDGCKSTSTAVTVTLKSDLSAPVAKTPQEFCLSATVADLEAEGTGIKWYVSETSDTPLDPSDSLDDGAIYYAAQSTNECESSVRTAVKVIIGDAMPSSPSINSPQSFCGTATLLDIATDVSNIVWYSASEGGDPLDVATELTTGQTYYAAKRSGECESTTRTAVQITITTELPINPTVTTAQTFCDGSTIANIVVPNDQIVWYNAAIGGSLLDPTTLLSNNTTYFAAQRAGECESASRTPVVITIGLPNAPTAPAQQTICNGSILADLEVTGNSIVWYNVAENGTPLSPETVLVNGVTYYAAQSTGSCESATRTPITVTLTTPSAPLAQASQAFCGSATVADLVAEGGTISWYSQATGGTALALTDPLIDGEVYYARAELASCISASTAVTVTILDNLIAPLATTPQTFCLEATVADLEATGVGLKWYAGETGGTALAETETLVSGAIYYVAQSTATCESSVRTAVKVNLEETLTLDAPTIASPQTFCAPVTLSDIATDGSTIAWYLGAKDQTPLPSDMALMENRTYYAAQKAANCESEERTPVEVRFGTEGPAAPAITSPQSFCSGAMLANISVPNNQIVWYATETSVSPLDATTMLIDGMTYYAAQKAGTCESETRTPVSIEIGTPAAPVTNIAQTVCKGNVTLADLTVTGSSVVWYADATGGSVLPLDTELVSGDTYYAVQKDGDCEGDTRIGVTVTVTALTAPVADAAQIICGSGATIANLVATVDEEFELVWFDADDNKLESTTPLTDGATYYAKAIKGVCESDATSVTVTLNSALSTPTIASVSGNSQLCGDEGSMMLQLTNPEAFENATYQWYNGEDEIVGATDILYKADAEGTYRIYVATTECDAFSAEFEVSDATSADDITTPELATLPTSGTLCGTGSSVVLSVSNSTIYPEGTTYIWFKGTEVVQNGALSSYEATEEGDYYVEVVDASCSSVSASTEITSSIGGTITEPAIASVSGNSQLCGDEGSMMLQLTNPEDFTGTSYQWYNGNELIAGATEVMYKAEEAGYYRLFVSTSDCGAFSEVFEVSEATSADDIITPELATLPTSGALCGTGSTVILSVSNSDIYPSGATYIWFKGTEIVQNGTKSSFEATEAGEYYVEVVNASCSSVSESTTVSTSANSITLPAIASVSGNDELCGDEGSMMLQLTNPTAFTNATYQWYNGDVAIAGATEVMYKAETAGSYRLFVATNDCGAFSAEFEVSEATSAGDITAPELAALPTGATLCGTGSTVILNVSNSNIYPAGTTYIWFKGVEIVQNGTLSSYEATTEGEYYVEVVDASCSSVSASITVSTSASGTITTPAIASVSGNSELCGAEGSMMLQLTNPDAFTNATYQWYNGEAAIAGATEIMYKAEAAGSYRLQVLAGECLAFSGSVDVTDVVGDIETPELATVPASGTLCGPGTSVMLSVSNADLYPSTAIYIWFNGTEIVQKSRSASYEATVEGNYYVEVVDGTCSSVSDITNVVEAIDPVEIIEPIASAFPSNKICGTVGGSVTLRVDNAAMFANATYQWYKGTTLLQGQTESSYEATALGTYRVYVVIEDECAIFSNTITVETGSNIIFGETPLVNVCAETAAGTLTPPTITDPSSVVIPGSGKWLLDGLEFNPAADILTVADNNKELTYEVQTSCGPVTSSPVSIKVTAKPTFTLKATDAICLNQSYDLSKAVSAVSAATYTLKYKVVGAAGQYITEKFEVFPAETTEYEVIVIESSLGCESEPQVITLTVNPLPTISIEGPTELCSRGTISDVAFTATTDPAGGEGVWSSSVTSVAQINPTTGAIINARNAGTTQITYTYTDPNGCVNSKSVELEVFTSPTLELADEFEICSGSKVIFRDLVKAHTGDTLLFYADNTLLTESREELTASKTYTVISRNRTTGCESLPESITVDVTEGLTLQLEDKTICFGSDIDLSNTVVGYDLIEPLDYTLHYMTESGFESPKVVSPDRTTIYRIKIVNNASQCASEPKNVTITVTPLPEIVTVELPIVCSGSTVDLTKAVDLTKSAPGLVPSYYVDDQGTLVENTTITATANHTYYVQGIAGDCKSELYPIYVTVMELPAFELVSNMSICTGKELLLTNLVKEYNNLTDTLLFYSEGVLITTASEVLTADKAYTVRAKNRTTGCISYPEAITVKVNETFTFSLEDVTICEGGKVDLSTTIRELGSPLADYTVTYMSANGAILPSNEVYPDQTTDYQISLVDNTTGCQSGPESVTVTVVETPEISIFELPAICAGEIIDLSQAIDEDNSTLGITLRYYSDKGMTSVKGTTVKPAGSHTYYVQGKLSNCISDFYPIEVTVNNLPELELVSKMSVCADKSLDLVNLVESHGGDTLLFYADGNLILTESETLTSDKTYQVISRDRTTGCESLPKSITVKLSSAFTFDLEGVTICEGGTVDLSTTIRSLASDLSDYEITYLSANGVLLPSEMVSPDKTTTYRIKLQDKTTGCVAGPEDVTVTVVETPEIAVVALSTVCAGSIIDLNDAIDLAKSTVGISLSFYSDQGITAINPEIKATANHTYYVQAELDNCESIFYPISVTVSSLPNLELVSNISICSGNSLTLTSLVADYTGADTLLFYSEGTLITTAKEVLTTDKSYTVIARNRTTGCVSLAETIIVEVNEGPIFTMEDVTICQGASVDLSTLIRGVVLANFDATYMSANGLELPSKEVEPSKATTYKVQLTDKTTGCKSDILEVEVDVVATPVISKFELAAVCADEEVDLSDAIDVDNTTTGLTLRYYSDLGMTAVSGTVVKPLTNHTYYVQGKLGDCISDFYPIEVTVNTLPTLELVKAMSLCPGKELTLSNLVAETTGDTLMFYSEGALITVASEVLTADKSYTVVAKNRATGCVSLPQAITVKVSSVFTFELNDIAICQGSNVDLSTLIGGLASSLSDYDVTYMSANGTIISSEVSPEVTTTYKVQLTDKETGCESAIQEVEVEVISTPVISKFELAAVCADEEVDLSEAIDADNTTTGLTLRYYSDLGMTAVSGTVVKPLTNHTYYVQGKLGDCISDFYPIEVTVNALPTLTLVPKMSVCEGKTLILANLVDTHTGDSLVFSSEGTPVTTLSEVITTAKTYTVVSKNTETGCVSAAKTITVEVSSEVSFELTDTAICAGGSVDLSTTISGLASLLSDYDVTYMRANGLGLASSEVEPKVTTTYKIKLKDKETGCESEVKDVTVNVTAKPVLVLKPIESVCEGTTVDLADAIDDVRSTAGANLVYYSNAEGDEINSEVVVSENATYYVQANLGTDCVSDLKAINVSVKAVPTFGEMPSVSVCAENVAGRLTAPSITDPSNVVIAGTGVWKLDGQVFDPETDVLALADNNKELVYEVNTTCGVVSSAATQVTVNAVPVFTLQAADVVCSGTIYDLTNAISTTSAYSSIQYRNVAGGLSFTNPEVILSATTTYEVVMIGEAPSFCASEPQQITITVTAEPEIEIVALPAVCMNTEVNLSDAVEAAPEVTLRYYMTEGGVSLGGSTVKPSVAGTTTYYVQGTAGNNCKSDFYPIEVTATELPALELVSNMSVCSGKSLILANLVKDYNNATDTLLFYAEGSLILTDRETLDANKTYTVVSRNRFAGCESISRTITVEVSDEFSFELSGATICEGSNFDLSTTISGLGSILSDYTVTYMDRSGEVISKFVSPDETSIYNIKLTDNSTGCEAASQSVTVTVTAKPEIAFVALPSVCAGTTVDLTDAIDMTNSTLGVIPTFYYDMEGTAIGGYTVTPTSDGTYTYYVRGNVGTCPSDYQSFTLKVNSIPTLELVSEYVVCSETQVALANLVANHTGSELSFFDANTNDPILTAKETLTADKTYKVISRSASGCESAPKYVTVEVTSNPEFTLAESVSICEGGSINLAKEVKGVTVTDYSIEIRENGSLISNPVVSPDVETTYTIKVVADGCSSTTKAITVEVGTIPTIQIGGLDVVCAGQGIQLTANPAGGEWISSNPAVATVDQDGNVTGMLKGNVVLTYIYTNGLCSNQANHSVTVNATPTVNISGNSIVCQNAVETYTATSGMSAYTWTVDGGQFLQGNESETVEVKWTNAGDRKLTLTYENENGCAITTPKEFNVTVNALLVPEIAGSQSVCAGATGVRYTADVDQTDVYAYQWEVKGGTIVSADYMSEIIVDWDDVNAPIGYVTLSCTSNSGCTSSDKTITVDINPTPSISGPNFVCLPNTGGGETYTVISPASRSYTWSIEPNGAGSVISGQGTPTAVIKWEEGYPLGFTGYVIVEDNEGESLCKGEFPVILSGYTESPVITEVVDGGSVAVSAIACFNATKSYTTTSLAQKNYNWSFEPAGFGEIISGQGTPSVEVLWSTEGQGKLTLIVETNEGCILPTGVQDVNVRAVPTVPTITSEDDNYIVCANAIASYSTEAGMDANSYVWSIVPENAGVIISGQGTNEVLVEWSGDRSVAELFVTYTSGRCTPTQEGRRRITINSLPSNDDIDFELPASICLGSNVELHPTIENGTWSISGNGDGTITDDIFTPTTAGIVTISYKVNISGCGTSAQTTRRHEVMINALPSVASFTAPAFACYNTDFELGVKLTGTAPFAITYSDGTNSETVENINTTTFDISVAGIVIPTAYSLLRVVDGNGCVNNMSITTSNVELNDAQPVISTQPMDQYFCPEDNQDNLEFSVVAENAVAYQWYKDGVALEDETSSTLSLASGSADEGSYYAIVYGACSSVQTKVVSSKAQLNNIIHQKLSHTLVVNNNSATNGGYTFVSYKWYKNGVESKNEDKGGYYYTGGNALSDDDEYYVILTDDKGITYRTCPYTPALIPADQSISVYPNPLVSSEMVYVDADVEDAELENAWVEIYSPLGAYIGKVKAQRLTPIRLPEEKGVYILKFSSENVEEYFKIIVK